MLIALSATLAMASAAASPTVRLSWELEPGLEACPDERWVRTAVAARLGRDPFNSQAPRLVRAAIKRAQGQELEALVETTRDDGTTARRSLRSPTGDCLELASSAELAITLAIEPAWLVRPRAPAEAPSPAPAPATAVAPAPPPPTRSWHLSGRATPLVTAGAAPGFTGGLAIGASVDGDAFGLALEGRALWPTSILFGQERADTFSSAASLLPCLHLGRFTGCGLASVGLLRTRSSLAGVPPSLTVMAQGGARAAIRFALGEHLAVSPWFEGAVVLTPTTVTSGTTRLWESWPASLSAGATFELRFSSWESP